MIVVDVEASGLNAQQHSLLSIGALDFFHPENQFYGECRIFEGAEISEEALMVNGFTLEQITDPKKPDGRQLMQDFINWSTTCAFRVIAGQNTSFDRDFLQATTDHFQLDWKVGFRTLDLHTLCYAHFLKRGLTPPSKNNLSELNAETIFPYLGLPVEPRPHNGLTGAKMEAEAFSRLIYKKGLLPEYSASLLPDYL